ncbi:uncharacterized protein si:ch211-170d8.2 [Hypomesus transpacificus]|uniref:uncharacterized protein si:ch211-170d8.2 n=1 Tax=Hypomesus transpacificus TaxID=137520 RepID=UPI001F0844B6|nr:uncharacterized protein si:ch211-170d8.2 [Hypomesus transpacificus]
MASIPRFWNALRLLFLIYSVVGVQLRAVGPSELLLKSSAISDGQDMLRSDSFRRLRRETLEAQREQCALLTEPWTETYGSQGDLAKSLHLRVLSLPLGGSRRTVFPEQPLFRYVRRVYRCCQIGFHCKSVKGIQGRLSGDTGVEFLLSRDVLSVTVMRAEIHLQLSNPRQLNVEPVLPFMVKRKLSTRYNVRTRDDILELRVDLLFLFQGLQEAADGNRGGPSLVAMRKVGGFSRGGPRERPSLQDTNRGPLGEGPGPLQTALELGLGLNCNKGGVEVSCEHNGLHLVHTPFIAISYR